MSLDPAILRAMAAAGASTEIIIAAVQAAKDAEELALAEKRARAAAKKRRQREERPPVSPGHQGTEGDNEGQVGTPPNPPLSPPDPQTPPLPPQTTQKGAKRATSFPDDFEPNKTDLDCFAEQGIHTAEQRSAIIAHWRDHHTAKGSMFKDWHAALRTWLRSPYLKTTGPPSDSRQLALVPGEPHARHHQNRFQPSGHQPRRSGFDAVAAGVARVATARGLNGSGRGADMEPRPDDPGVVDADWSAAQSH